MTHSPLLPRLLLLCLAGALALAPAARAQEEDPNSVLGKTGSPCFDTSDVEESLALPDPNDPNAPLAFADLADCPKLCKRAGLACAKQAKLAGACESRWADDRALFAVKAAIKLDCADKTGAALKECIAGIETVRRQRRDRALERQDTEVAACLERGTRCVEKCVATPPPAPRGMGVLWNELVCTEPGAAAAKFDFDQSFVGLPDCEKLCANARTACRRHVDAAASCQREFAKEWIALDQAVDCAGLTGSRLRDCKDGWALDLQGWRAAIDQTRAGGRLTCELELFGNGTNSNPGCLELCTGQ